jgi:protein gp37
VGLTKIEWTASADGSRPGYSHNHWVGCEKISPACDGCYAEAWAKRSGQAGLWAGERRLTSDTNREAPYRWDRAAAAAGRRDRVFCSSLSDVFDTKVPQAWRMELFQTIMLTPNLDWLLLTKRPGSAPKLLRCLQKLSATGTRPLAANPTATSQPDSTKARERPADTTLAAWIEEWLGGSPPHNVWVGTTIEDKARAGLRLPALARIPARIRFVSAEPLLEDWSDLVPDAALHRIDWIICGGETGAGAREMPEAWAERLRNACSKAGIAFYMKQMTRKGPIPANLMVREQPIAEARGRTIPA